MATRKKTPEASGGGNVAAEKAPAISSDLEPKALGVNAKGRVKLICKERAGQTFAAVTGEGFTLDENGEAWVLSADAKYLAGRIGFNLG